MPKRTGTKKTTIFLSEDKISKYDEVAKYAHCASRSEFVEKALDFYCGYVLTQDNADYFSTAIDTMLDGKISMLGSQIGKVIYKLAVEVQTMMYMTGDIYEADMEKIDRAREYSEDDVKSINGILDFKQVVNLCREGKRKWRV